MVRQAHHDYDDSVRLSLSKPGRTLIHTLGIRIPIASRVEIDV
jgi:hypothetical protein